MLLPVGGPAENPRNANDRLIPAKRQPVADNRLERYPMNVSVRIHVEADTFLDHEVFPPARPGDQPCAWVSIGHKILPPAEFATHDVEALERLAAEFQAAAEALRTALGDTFAGNGMDEDDLDAALLADGAA